MWLSIAEKCQIEISSPLRLIIYICDGTACELICMKCTSFASIQRLWPDDIRRKYFDVICVVSACQVRMDTMNQSSTALYLVFYCLVDIE